MRFINRLMSLVAARSITGRFCIHRPGAKRLAQRVGWWEVGALVLPGKHEEYLMIMVFQY